MTTPISPFRWVPSLYFMQGLPFAIVTMLSTVFYKEFGISNTDIAVATSLLSLPWALKLIWSPFLEGISTKKHLIVMAQMSVALMLMLLALFMQTKVWPMTLPLFALVAVAAAIHDVSADGYYMVVLSSTMQARFVGYRTCFFHLARFFCQGVILILVGFFETAMSKRHAWQLNIGLLSLVAFILAGYHRNVLIENENQQQGIHIHWWQNFVFTLRQYLNLANVISNTVFLVVFNFAEAQLSKIVPLFLLDNVANGGLHLTTATVGILIGGCGVSGLVIGAIISSYIIAKYVLKNTLLPMTLFATFCDLGYWLLSYVSHPNVLWAGVVIFLSQFAAGMITSAYMTFLLQFVAGNRMQMSLYALATTIMLGGSMLAGVFSGWMQVTLGYNKFFIAILVINMLIFCYAVYLYRRQLIPGTYETKRI